MEDFFIELSIILVGSALLASLAVIYNQPIILAYILCGVVFGPNVIGWVKDVHFIENISHLGITLLLFLAGLNLQPSELIKIFKRAALTTAGNSLFSFLIGFSICYIYGFQPLECFIIGMALMFSSTILVVKLIPTTELHHKRMGTICIGILILQDLLAVGVLAFIRCFNAPSGLILEFSLLTGKLILFLGTLLLFENYILRRVMRKVDRLQEALFILGLAWCFGVATISHSMGLFYETGAFFSGVLLARHKIALHIASELKPLRDFFLVLFFFTLGAKIDLFEIPRLVAVSVLLTACFIVLRPMVINQLMLFSGEQPGLAKEAGIRLGQLSEFSLLVGLLAVQEQLISNQAAQLIQLVTIISFVISSYIVCHKYPTPIGVSSKLMRD